MKYKNEGTMDRLIRFLLSEIFLLAGFFWLGGLEQILSYLIGAVLLITSILGFCGLYKLFKINTLNTKPTSKWFKVVAVIVALLLPTVGSYYSAFFTKKFFLDDYNRMNNYYKQTLFYTGQEKRDEARSNYDKWVIEFASYQNKYSNYRPYALKQDQQFGTDLTSTANIISNLKEDVYTGDLKLAHTKLESVRPIFQDMLKRNGFSMLAVYLVDFHDAMEKVITASDNKDSSGVIEAYNEANQKLKEVENLANDEGIQNIRQKLDDVLSLAKENKNNELSDKAAELKSAFVKVYLNRN